jgi:3-hydroxybutyrate dehydrogenase
MNQQAALVTGAASGIGLAISRDLAQQGYTVIVSDTNLEAAQNAADEINAQGHKALAYRLDVCNDADIEQVIKDLQTQSLDVVILVNNAGLQHVSKLEDFPPERWRLINNVLLVAPAMLTRAVLPGMRQQNFGRIVNIGSIHSLVASAHKSAYVAAKHGLLGFSKVIALETANQNITINTVCPSYVKTPLVEMQIANQAKENGITEEEVINKIMLEPMPKKNFIEMDELTGAVNYLLSEAARNMTGHELVLDGGWTVR